MILTWRYELLKVHLTDRKDRMKDEEAVPVLHIVKYFLRNMGPL